MLMFRLAVDAFPRVRARIAQRSRMLSARLAWVAAAMVRCSTHLILFFFFDTEVMLQSRNAFQDTNPQLMRPLA